MVFWRWIFTASTWLLGLGWAWQALDRWLHRQDVSFLSQLSMTPMDEVDGPHLTVVVPACNEQDAIEATLRGLLASQGLRLQILAVNDRSTDATGARMEAVATEYCGSACGHTLEVLHIRELPPGWLGKPHALALAARRAQATWILFTDGDVEFAPEALARALAFAQREEADHLAVLPDWVVTSRAERAMQGAMFAMTGWGLRYWKIADPKARDFLGVGAFNLMRTSSYEAVGGFEALRMEVLEDLRIGWRVKQAGLRQRFAWGQGMIRVRWANGAWGVVRNLEKNVFALFRYRLLVALGACAGVALHIALPLLALAAGGWARGAGVLSFFALAAVYAVQQKRIRVPVWYVIFFPFALTLFLFAMARSITMTLVRGGVVWRGTLYPIRALRAAAGNRW